MVEVCSGEEWFDDRNDGKSGPLQSFGNLVEERAEAFGLLNLWDEALQAWLLAVRVADGHGYSQSNPPFALYMRSKVVSAFLRLDRHEQATSFLASTIERATEWLGDHRTTRHLNEMALVLARGEVPQFGGRGTDDAPFANDFVELARE
jgi:hypothetical protein